MRLASSLPMRALVLLRAAALVLVVMSTTVLGSSAGSGAQVDDADPTAGPVYLMRVTGPIDLGLAPYIDRVVTAAGGV